MVTLRQLQYFVQIVAENSFTEAASELRVSQSGLSHQVKTLEAGLGGPLFERLGRGIRLTTLGREVLPLARAVLLDSRRVQDRADQVLGLLGGTVEVATLNSLSLGVLPRVLCRWRTSRPAVSIGLHEFPSLRDLVTAMEGGVGDLGIAPLPAGWPGPSWELGIEEFVIVVGQSHRLAQAGATTARMEELAVDPWIHFSEQHDLAKLLTQTAASSGFEPLVAMRTGQTAAVPGFAAAGIGAALVPANIIGVNFPGHLLRPDPPIVRKIFAFIRSEPDSLLSSFIAGLSENIDLTPEHVRSRCGVGEVC
ncbi:MAG: LysR family transcriptional regulator [Renibacterium salmoninarum]|nr:LysR family transcriptional regulator [Renibacterium salmoninarum]